MTKSYLLIPAIPLKSLTTHGSTLNGLEQFIGRINSFYKEEFYKNKKHIYGLSVERGQQSIFSVGDTLEEAVDTYTKETQSTWNAFDCAVIGLNLKKKDVAKVIEKNPETLKQHFTNIYLFNQISPEKLKSADISKQPARLYSSEDTTFHLEQDEEKSSCCFSGIFNFFATKKNENFQSIDSKSNSSNPLSRSPSPNVNKGSASSYEESESELIEDSDSYESMSSVSLSSGNSSS